MKWIRLGTFITLPLYCMHHSPRLLPLPPSIGSPKNNVFEHDWLKTYFIARKQYDTAKEQFKKEQRRRMNIARLGMRRPIYRTQSMPNLAVHLSLSDYELFFFREI